MEEKIALIREQQNQTFDRTTVVSAEQKERKEAILKQYAQVADGEGYVSSCTYGGFCEQSRGY